MALLGEDLSAETVNFVDLKTGEPNILKLH
jgi:hypothetical protein